METVSQSDMNLLNKATHALNEANAAMRFVSAHFVDTYNLGPKDTINPATGEILRADDNN